MANEWRIVFRVFSYSYHHAEKNRISCSGNYYLNFPEPQVIYLHSDSPIPEKYVLHIRFGDRRIFDYEVPTINLKNLSAQEFMERKLGALLPFQLLKLRKLFMQNKENITPIQLKQLQDLLFSDILLSIQNSEKSGLITSNDAIELLELTQILFEYLYGAYPETMEVRSMFDQSLHLEIDDYVIAHMKLEDAFKAQTQQCANLTAKLKTQTQQLSQKDAEIARLKAELAKRN